ncbi:MAG: PepSY domain-containing protein [bacterium]
MLINIKETITMTMMTSTKQFLSVILLLIFILPSGGRTEQIKYNQTSNNFLDTNTAELVKIFAALEFVSSIFAGEILKAERKFKKDIPVWEMDMVTTDKGIIEIEISAIDKSLQRIDADEGPFEYEIDPGESSIKYKAARKIAEEFTGQKTLKWNYFRNRNGYEYNFWLFTKSGKAQVRVNAETGEILTKTKKIKK